MKRRSLLFIFMLSLVLLLPVAAISGAGISDPMVVVSNWLIPKDAFYNIPGWGVQQKQPGIHWETPGIVMDDILFHRNGRTEDWHITLRGPRAGVETITLQSNKGDKVTPKTIFNSRLKHHGFKIQVEGCASDGVLISLTDASHKPIWVVVADSRLIFFTARSTRPDVSILRRADLLQDFLPDGACQF